MNWMFHSMLFTTDHMMSYVYRISSHNETRIDRYT